MDVSEGIHANLDAGMNKTCVLCSTGEYEFPSNIGRTKN